MIFFRNLNTDKRQAKSNVSDAYNETLHFQQFFYLIKMLLSLAQYPMFKISKARRTEKLTSKETDGEAS